MAIDLTEMLPFLKALRQPGFVDDPEGDIAGDPSGAPDDGSAAASAVPDPTKGQALEGILAAGLQGGPAVARSRAQLSQNPTPAEPSPDRSLAAPARKPADPVADLTQSIAEGDQAPNLRSTFYKADNGGPAKLTGAGMLATMLHNAVVDAENSAAGISQSYAATGRNGGVGAAIAGQQERPIDLGLKSQQLQRWGIENEMQRQQLMALPFIQALQYQKGQADLSHTQAETAAIPIETQLKQAQANAAKYEKVGDSLYDVSGSTPQMVAGATAVLDVPTAQVLGKQPGDRVPIDVAKAGKDLVDQGLSYTQANGHNWLVDKQGNKLKDMGVATPMAIINAQMNAPAQVTPEMSAAAGRVAAGKIDLATALAPFRRFPGQSEAFLNEVFNQNPDYSQATYGVSKKTMEYFTTGAGANELTAFRTAIAHADLLEQAARELNNPDSRTLAAIQNRLTTEFGDPRLTTFNAIVNAYNHEVTAAISKGHITDKEVSAGDATMPSNANLQTILSVANAYKGLMASKAQQRMIQYEQGLQGQAAFPAGITPAAPAKFNPAALPDAK